MRGGQKAGIGADRVEVGLRFGEPAVAIIEFDRLGKMLDRCRRIAGEGEVAGEVVVKDRLIRIDLEATLESVHRLREPIEPLQAPAQAEPGLDPLGIPLDHFGEGLEGLRPMAEGPQRLATEEGRCREGPL